MARYEFSPGISASGDGRWPEGSRVPRKEGQFTLVMLAHPRCPCTRASIGELEQTMARTHGSMTACVVFFKPADTSADWEKSGLWQSAAAIPGVSVISDEDGAEARRFGSETSGQTLLYDAAGRLLFRGGITASRGHVGENAGSETIVSLVTRGVAELRETPVFGCPIHDPGK